MAQFYIVGHSNQSPYASNVFRTDVDLRVIKSATNQRQENPILVSMV